MMMAPRRGRSHALLVIADFKKEFWFHVRFLLIACAIRIFDKFILSKLLSDLTVLIRNCAVCISVQVAKTKILLINSIHKPPVLFSFRLTSSDHLAIVEPFQF